MGMQKEVLDLAAVAPNERASSTGAALTGGFGRALTGGFGRALVLTAGILGVLQYGLVLTFGTTLRELEAYYHISKADGAFLYSSLNFGSCAMSFVPGLMFDRFGPLKSMVIGTVVGIVPVLIQLQWSSSVPGIYALTTCYVLFGTSSAFFNVIGVFGPLAAFGEEHVGKVSALVQICMSLGISIQSAAFGKAVSSGDFTTYLLYVLVFTGGSGLFMCLVFKACGSLFAAPAVANDAQDEQCKESACASVLAKLASLDFAFMVVLFVLAIGFSFSFLGLEAEIAASADVRIESLNLLFGPLNALGRLAVSLPLDYTREHRFGGPLVYLTCSLVLFACGLLCLALPASAGPEALQLANGFIALGYGGTMGMVPPALRLSFGTEHLGLIYGLLYALVALAEPAWGLLNMQTASCSGVECYRLYCGTGAAAILTTACVAAGLLLFRASRGAKIKPQKTLLEDQVA